MKYKLWKNGIMFGIVILFVGASIIPSVSGIVSSRTYTLDADFDEGILVGVEYETVHDQLQLSEEIVTLPFIWVPNQGQGTVSKVDTDTGKELARYRVAPYSSCSPSRTTVDLQGSCWVGNRQAGTVVKIGLYEAGIWIDRNINGICDTSQDLNNDGDITGAELLAWGQDECVLYEVILISGSEGTFVPGTYGGTYDYSNWGTSPRGLGIDSNNNLWAGTWNPCKYYYINGSTGAILNTVDLTGVHNAYGAVIDGNGILWSSGQSNNHVMRMDPSTSPPTISYLGMGHFTYGLGLDYKNHLFASGWTSSKFSRVNLSTATKDWTKGGPYTSRGVVCTSDNDVWVASTNNNKVYRYDNNGNFITSITVGNGPTGVAVDSNEKVWACNLNDDTIVRINTTTNTVDLTKSIVGSGGHYSYSDMTGIVARTITTKIGTWTVDFDSEELDTPWGTVSWNSYEPVDTSVTVKVRSSNDQSSWSSWETATNGVDLSLTPDGRYLQIKTTLQITSGDTSPILYDLTVEIGNNPPVADANGPYTEYEGSPITFDASGSTDPDGDPLEYRWDFDNDGHWDTGWSSSPYATYTWCDDHIGTAMVEVSDGQLTDDDTAQVTVLNVAPLVDAGPDATVLLGLPFKSLGSFNDPGCDKWTATVNYGDGSGDQPLTLIGKTFTLYHIYGNSGDYTVTVTVTDDDLGVGIDTVLVTVLCAPEVWVDDDWHWQGDVDTYNPTLIWGHNAFNTIQDGVDLVCDCGTVYVLDGDYYEQILINKNVSLLGEPGATIKAPDTLNIYNTGRSPLGAPIIFAYGGTLTGSDVSGSGIISVMVDGFLINGLEKSGTVGILYHNVESGCIQSVISNNTIENIDVGIKIDGCTDDTTIIHNRITWPAHTMDKIGIVITESGGCEPTGVEIHHNYLGIECGLNIGVWNQVSDIVNATFNWWGAPDGPSSPDSGDTFDAITGKLADGYGEHVIGLVHFDPWAGIEASGTVTVSGRRIRFDASDSFAYHIDGTPNTILLYKWKFGDGYFSFKKSGSHNYRKPGTYTVTLRVMTIDTNLWDNFMYDWAKFTVKTR